MKKKVVKSSKKTVKAPVKKKAAVKKSSIKTVIFDMGNVLLHYDATKAGKAFAKVCGASFLKLFHVFGGKGLHSG
jgi:hypothetical protein